MEENPYAAPKSDVISPELGGPEAGEPELAGRWKRLVAVMIDGLLNLALLGPVMYFNGIWGRAMQGIQMSVEEQIFYVLLAIVVFLALQSYLLHTQGQTIGKWLLKIRIVNLSGEKPPFARLMVFRFLPVTLVAQIPVVGSVLSSVEALFIFRKDRRCLHDLIAGTRVVKA